MASYWSIIRAYIQITILTKSEGPPFSQKKILRIFHSKDKKYLFNSIDSAYMHHQIERHYLSTK